MVTLPRRLFTNQSVQVISDTPVGAFYQGSKHLSATNTRCGLLPGFYQRELEPMFVFLHDDLARKISCGSSPENTFRLRGWNSAAESLQPVSADLPGIRETTEIANQGGGEIRFVYREIVGGTHPADFCEHPTQSRERRVRKNELVLGAEHFMVPPPLGPIMIVGRYVRTAQQVG